MASRLLSASSRAASCLKISVFKRRFSSGKSEEEQLGEDMKKKFDEMNSKCWKFLELKGRANWGPDVEIRPFRGRGRWIPDVEIGTIRVGGSPKEQIFTIMQFTIDSGGRWIVGTNLYVVDKDDVKRKDTRRCLKTIGFDIDLQKRTVVPIHGHVEVDV